jgi:hypothetical protein
VTLANLSCGSCAEFSGWDWCVKHEARVGREDHACPSHSDALPPRELSRPGADPGHGWGDDDDTGDEPRFPEEHAKWVRGERHLCLHCGKAEPFNGCAALCPNCLPPRRDLPPVRAAGACEPLGNTGTRSQAPPQTPTPSLPKTTDEQARSPSR